MRAAGFACQGGGGGAREEVVEPGRRWWSQGEGCGARGLAAEPNHSHVDLLKVVFA